MISVLICICQEQVSRLTVFSRQCLLNKDTRMMKLVLTTVTILMTSSLALPTEPVAVTSRADNPDHPCCPPTRWQGQIIDLKTINKGLPVRNVGNGIFVGRKRPLVHHAPPHTLSHNFPTECIKSALIIPVVLNGGTP